MNDIKIVIGANYGDEGKGLVTRQFCIDAIQKGLKPVVIFHNGTAQRGHTVDYSAGCRHVYHHFGSGTGDRVPTFFTDTFLIHPMEFRREMCEELIPMMGIIPPISYCDPNAKIITPFDMVVDHCTLEHIAKLSGDSEFEHGTCGYGSWCAAEDRIPAGRTAFSINDFVKSFETHTFEFLMNDIWKECLIILASRGVDIEKSRYAYLLKDRKALMENFKNDLLFFLRHTKIIDFNSFYLTSGFNSFIFENGQGLGLDMNNGTEWHTTSNTGLVNPYKILNGYNNFNAEVCYVTRSYLTRHGIGNLEEEVNKDNINAVMHDKTNVPNDFQGSLRYGYLEDNEQKLRIKKDFSIVAEDTRFNLAKVITHTNEFDCGKDNSEYYSDNPYTMTKRM